MLLVVDAAEGSMMVTEKAIKQATSEGLPISLLITKVPSLAEQNLCCCCAQGQRVLCKSAGRPADHRAQAAACRRVSQAAACHRRGQ